MLQNRETATSIKSKRMTKTSLVIWEKNDYEIREKELCRGYYMAARGYEFYSSVPLVFLMSECSERVRDTTSTRR